VQGVEASLFDEMLEGARGDGVEARATVLHGALEEQGALSFSLSLSFSWVHRLTSRLSPLTPVA
jgi:hypothetical protein